MYIQYIRYYLYHVIHLNTMYQTSPCILPPFPSHLPRVRSQSQSLYGLAITHMLVLRYTVLRRFCKQAGFAAVERTEAPSSMDIWNVLFAQKEVLFHSQ